MSENKKYAVFYAEYKYPKNEEDWEDVGYINVVKQDCNTMSEVCTVLKNYCERFPNMVMGDPGYTNNVDDADGNTYCNCICFATENNFKEDKRYYYSRELLMF